MGSFTCINSRCGALLDDHEDGGPLPGRPEGAADTRALTVCLYCMTVIALGPSGPREPLPAEREAVQGSDAYRMARVMHGFLTAAARRAAAHLN